MPNEVRIEVMNFRGAPWGGEPSGVEADVRAIVEAMEAELDATLGEEVDLYLEQVDIELRGVAALDVRAAIGRALAKHIVLAARLGQARLETGSAPTHSRDGDGVVRLAGASGAASKVRARRSEAARSAAEPEVRSTGARTSERASSDEELAPSLAALARVARSRRWLELIGSLDEAELEAWLRALLEELSASFERPPTLETPNFSVPSASSLRQTVAETVMTASAELGDAAPASTAWYARLSALVLVGETARLGARRLKQQGRLRALLAEEVRAALLRTSSNASRDTTTRAPGVNLEHREASNDPAPFELPRASRAASGLDHAEPELPLDLTQERERTASSSLAQTVSRYSACAGLAFLVPLLDDLGLGAALLAVHPEPSLFVYRLLCSVVEALELPGLADDAALWLLAGLEDAPNDADLETDATLFEGADLAALARAGGSVEPPQTLTDVAAIWSQAVLVEASERLASARESNAQTATDDVDLGREVVGLGGELSVSEQRVVVSLSYPRRYESLLRAGMLAERSVPWLGERLLGFAFHGGVSDE